MQRFPTGDFFGSKCSRTIGKKAELEKNFEGTFMVFRFQKTVCYAATHLMDAAKGGLSIDFTRLLAYPAL